MSSSVGSDPGAGTRRWRAVVVDDEPAGREAVTTFLSEVPSVEVVGEAADGREAVRVVEATRPDLLFLDVQMPHGHAFDVLDALGDAVPRGVVLVTAHGEYAQRAFDVHAVDYVIKPFGRPRFMAAVERALRRLSAEDALDMRGALRSLVRNLRHDAVPGPAGDAVGGDRAGISPARIGVRLGTKTTLVDVDDIDWVEADGELVRIHVGDHVHLLKSRMVDLEAMLGTEKFMRIHRSVIVRLDGIRVLHRDADGGGSAGLRSGVQLRVARARWSALQGALGLETD